MTAAAITGFVEVPSMVDIWAASDTATTLDATTDYVAFVCRAPATGTIDKVYARIGSTTLSGTLSCQIQTLDASGDPSGTAYGSCAQSDVAVTGTEDNTEITFASLSCSATIGDYICIRIWASTVTSGSVNVLSTSAASLLTVGGFPYQTVRTTGTGAGTKGSVSIGPTIEYSGAVYYNVGWIPTTTLTTEAIDSDGTVRRLGNRFILPVPMTVIGAWCWIDTDTDTTTVRLYDTDGTTELTSVAMVAVNRQASTAKLQRILFPAAVNLSANTANAYRLVITTDNTSATASSLVVATAITAAHMDMLPLGTDCYHTTHNGTSWTDTTTKRTAIGLLVSKFDDGAGGGGGLAANPIAGFVA